MPSSAHLKKEKNNVIGPIGITMLGEIEIDHEEKRSRGIFHTILLGPSLCPPQRLPVFPNFQHFTHTCTLHDFAYGILAKPSAARSFNGGPRSIDTSAAADFPGVVQVFTGKDVSSCLGTCYLWLAAPLTPLRRMTWELCQDPNLGKQGS